MTTLAEALAPFAVWVTHRAAAGLKRIGSAAALNGRDRCAAALHELGFG